KTVCNVVTSKTRRRLTSRAHLREECGSTAIPACCQADQISALSWRADPWRRTHNCKRPACHSAPKCRPLSSRDSRPTEKAGLPRHALLRRTSHPLGKLSKLP